MNHLLQEISSVASLLCERGWAERNAGNFSIRLDSIPSMPGPRRYLLPREPSPSWEEGQALLVTAAGVRMRDLREQPDRSLMIISFHGGQKEAMLYGLPGMEPSSELLTHLSVHSILMKAQPEERALLHAHVTELICLSHHPDLNEEQGLNDVLIRMHPETLYFLPNGVALTRFETPGSLALAEATALAFESRKVCVWPMHGALACGPSLEEAFDRMDMLAKTAQIWLRCKAAGFSPRGLSAQEIVSLKKAYGITGRS